MKMSKYIILVMVFSIVFIFSISQASDSVYVWYGNVDGSPVEANIGTDLEVNAYIQTDSDAYVGSVLLNLAGDGIYFDSLQSAELGEFYAPLTSWDAAYFLDVSHEVDELPEGWVSQGLFGLDDIMPPFNSPPLHSEVPYQIAKFVMSTTADPNNVGNLAAAIMPGIDWLNGVSNCGDTNGTHNYVVVESASLLQFAGGGWISGLIEDDHGNPVADVQITSVQTERSVMGNSEGEYTIGLAPGAYDLIFSVEGYRDIEQTGVTVSLNQTTPLNVVMDIGVGIGEDRAVPIPDHFELKQNYPNPFNATTSIEYFLAQQTHVVLAVYDIQGRLVEMLVDKEQEAGVHRVNWNADMVSSGMYFYKIQTDQNSRVQKMMLLK